MNPDSRLNDYARLVIEKGANVQQGEPVWINAQVNTAPFVRLLWPNTPTVVPAMSSSIGATTRSPVCLL